MALVCCAGVDVLLFVFGFGLFTCAGVCVLRLYLCLLWSYCVCCFGYLVAGFGGLFFSLWCLCHCLLWVFWFACELLTVLLLVWWLICFTVGYCWVVSYGCFDLVWAVSCFVTGTLVLVGLFGLLCWLGG